ncbi:MAG: tetratricopeptide repeat protein, partial [Flavobacteriales bacterium]|nr:tetratricopeptide repeat protein [Flavobacteriales bacterium]
MKKAILLLVMLNLFQHLSFAQQPDLDSLWGVWKDDSQADTSRLKAIYDFAWGGYLYSQPDSALYFAQLQYDLAILVGEKKWAANAAGLQGIVRKNQGDYAKAIDYHTHSLDIYKELGNKKEIARSMNNMGNVYWEQGNYIRAIDYHSRSLAIKEELGDKRGIAATLNNIGLVYYDQGDYVRAINQYTHSLDIYKELGDKKGIARSMNNMGNVYWEQGNYIRAIDYHSRSLVIKEELGDKKAIAQSLNNIGLVYHDQGDYTSTIDYYTRSLVIYEELGEKKGIARSLSNIGIIYRQQGDYVRSLEYYTNSLTVRKEIGDKQGIASTLLGIGNVYWVQSDYAKAVDYYTRSLAIYEELGDKRGIARSLNNIGIIYGEQGDSDKAIAYYTRSLVIKEESGNRKGMASTMTNMGLIYAALGDYTKAIEYGKRSLTIAQEVGAVITIGEAANLLYKTFKTTHHNSDALEMHELYIAMRDSILSEENQREVLRQEYKYTYEKEALSDSLVFAKKEAVKNLEIEKQQADIERQRIALGATVGGLLLIVALAFSIHRGKKRSDELLLNILPEETAKELKQKGYADAKQFDQVTVLFTDFKGFTQIAEKLNPKELVAEIDECFKAFDLIMEKYGIEKIKTIGDAYMAAGGLPVPNSTNPESVVKAGLEIRDWMLARARNSSPSGRLGGAAFEIRIGIHTGPVVAGIVGIKKFAYDIWGDTVNTASRMESSGEVGKVNISETTYQLVKDQFTCEYRG